MRVGFISLLTRTRGRTFIYMSVSFVLHHFLHTMVDLHSLEVMYCSWMICLKRTNVSCEQTERDHFLNWFIPLSVQFSLWRRRDRTVITWQRFVPERIRNELNCQPVRSRTNQEWRKPVSQWVRTCWQRRKSFSWLHWESHWFVHGTSLTRRLDYKLVSVLLSVSLQYYYSSFSIVLVREHSPRIQSFRQALNNSVNKYFEQIILVNWF